MNQVCVFASHWDHAQFLYPVNRIDTFHNNNNHNNNNSPNTSYSIAHAQSMYKQFRDVDEAVNKELKKLMEEQQKDNNINGNTHNNNNNNNITTSETKYSALSGALSLALTYMSKVCSISSDVRLRSRILILSVTGDLDAQYIPIMNSIFAAQSHVSFFFFLKK